MLTFLQSADLTLIYFLECVEAYNFAVLNVEEYQEHYHFNEFLKTVKDVL